MSRRSRGRRWALWAALLAAALTVAMGAGGLTIAHGASAPPLVKVRIEGQDHTIFNGAMEAGAVTLLDTNGQAHVSTGTPLSTIGIAAQRGAFTYSLKSFAFGLFLDGIAGELSDPNPPYPGWLYRVNGVDPGSTGPGQYQLRMGDSVLWYYGAGSFAPTPTIPADVLVAAREVPLGGTISVTAEKLDASGTPSPLPGATVHIGSMTVTSNAAGIATAPAAAIGDYGIQVEKADYVRSEVRSVRVGYRSAITGFIVAPARIRRGAAISIAGRLMSRGAGLANKPVLIHMRRLTSPTWRLLTKIRTGAGGAFGMTIRPTRGSFYRAVFTGDRTHLATTSPVRKSVVTP